MVLFSWWVFSGLFQLFLMSICLIRHFQLAALPSFLPESSVTDLASCPSSLLLCFFSISMNYSSFHELQQPLLARREEEEEEEEGGILRESFSTAGVWSRLTFCWLNPVFEKGRAQRLELPHIPSVPRSETAGAAYSSLQESLDKQKPELSSLVRAIISAVWGPLVINAVFAGINTLSSYLGPFLITNFVNFLSGEDAKLGHRHGYVLAFLFFFGKMVESLSQRQWYFGARQIGIRVRASLMVSIYNRSLMMKYSNTSSGKIINFLDVDVERIGDFFWYIHGIWLLPVQVFLALFILNRNLGFAASVSAFLTTVIVMVSNIPLANLQEKLHSKIMEAKDSRIKATAETLKCMRILKLHAWETAYLDKLLELRDAERKWLKRYLYTCSVIAFLFWTSPTLVSVAAFGVCILVKGPLTPSTVLSALATFRILQEPIYNLPELISVITQTKVSLDRIQDFIKDDEKKNPMPKCTAKVSDVAIEIEPGKYS